MPAEHDLRRLSPHDVRKIDRDLSVPQARSAVRAWGDEISAADGSLAAVEEMNERPGARNAKEETPRRDRLL